MPVPRTHLWVLPRALLGASSFWVPHAARAHLQAQYLLRNEGLFVGSSAAMNCVGAVKAARRLGPGHTVVTILCDGGHRHTSKFHNPEYLAEYGLAPVATGRGLDFVT